MSDDKVIAAKQRKSEELEAGNLRSYTEYREIVAREFNHTVNMNTGDTRIAALIQSLRDSGIMSDEQYWDFEIEFHSRVEKQLNEEWIKVRDSLEQRKKPKLSVVQKPSTLLDQHGKPIT